MPPMRSRQGLRLSTPTGSTSRKSKEVVRGREGGEGEEGEDGRYNNYTQVLSGCVTYTYTVYAATFVWHLLP